MRTIFVATALLAMMACSRMETPKTVDWYKEHKAEREALLAECKQHGLATSLDCENANKANIGLAAARRGYVKPKPVSFGKGG